MSDEDIPPDIANHPVVRELKALEPMLNRILLPKETMQILGLLSFIDGCIESRYNRRPNPLRDELDREKKLREAAEAKSEDRRLLLFLCVIVILFLLVARLFHF
jgi:hypothetical protein